ncbi:MAG: putative signal transducing protein [Cytophagaceae bacterium]
MSLSIRFTTIMTYDSHVEANIAKSKLLDSEIYCYLKDEHYVSMAPIHSNAIGGIKLQVREEDAALASELLGMALKEYKENLVCPVCASKDVHYVSSLKNITNWISFLFSLITGSYPVYVKKVYHCDHCNKEFNYMEEQ